MQNKITQHFFPLFLLPALVACSATTPGTGDMVPRELAEDLTGGQVYLGMPEGFPEFNLPEGVDVAGSLDQNSRIQVILRSELDPETFEQSVREELLGRGWTELVSPRPPNRQFGFVPNNIPAGFQFPRQLCHDRYGNISVNARGEAGIYHRLSLDWNRNSFGQQLSCEEQNQQRQGQFNPVMRTQFGLNQYLPVLELPEEDRGSRFRPSFGSGTSGSGDALTARSPLVIDWSMDEIIRWFSGQLMEQGWEQDAGWTGDTSAGSTWLKTVEDSTRLTGLLDIVREEENTYQLRFRLAFNGR